MKSPKDIMSASKYLDGPVDNDEVNKIRTEAFRTRLKSKDVNFRRVKPEIEFYRLTGETASNVITADAKAIDIR
jgi:hypothetical protein